MTVSAVKAEVCCSCSYAPISKQTALNMNVCVVFFFFRLEQNISRQRPLPQDIQPMSAENFVQCAAGLWSPQPNCGLLSGSIPEDPEPSSCLTEIPKNSVRIFGIFKGFGI